MTQSERFQTIAAVHKQSLRELRAFGILIRADQIRRVSDAIFLVRSQSLPSINYKVTANRQLTSARCNCPDYMKRKANCKHVFAVLYILNHCDTASYEQAELNDEG
jgi:hypothetical protein